MPPVTAEDRYGPMAAAGNSLPPHAFLYLGAVARALGWEVSIVDGPARGLTLGGCADAIMAHEPAVVGFTTTTMSIAKAATVARELRQRQADLVLMVGGPHVTALPEATFERLPYELLACPTGCTEDEKAHDTLFQIRRHEIQNVLAVQPEDAARAAARPIEPE